MAQQPEEQASPKNQKEAPVKTEKAEPKTPKTGGESAAKPEAMPKTHTAETKSGANLASPEATAPTQHGAKIERPAKVPKTDTAVKSEKSAGTETGVKATTETGTGKGKGRMKTEASVTGATTETGVNATTETGAGKGRQANPKGGGSVQKSATATGATGTSVNAEASATVAPSGKVLRGEKATKTGTGANAKASAAPSMTPVTAASATAAPSIAASATAAPSVAAATGASGQLNATTNANAPAMTGGTVKADPQKVLQVKQNVQTIKQKNVNFKAQPRPDRAPTVTFNVNYRIQGSDRWQGSQYEVFRRYHPERRDRGWYHSRYHRVELIAGGYYYFDNGYWFPAWGYDPGHEYYAYDAPIYVGRRAEPPDRVIADVQAELQEMGYYQGEVDGLTGPLTREALAAYQADQGLQVTAVMDEPTLDSLGMG